MPSIRILYFPVASSSLCILKTGRVLNQCILQPSCWRVCIILITIIMIILITSPSNNFSICFCMKGVGSTCVRDLGWVWEPTRSLHAAVSHAAYSMCSCHGNLNGVIWNVIVLYVNDCYWLKKSRVSYIHILQLLLYNWTIKISEAQRNILLSLLLLLLLLLLSLLH